MVKETASSKQYPWISEYHINPRKGTTTHFFLLILECPYPLLVRDLLHMLKVQFTIMRFRDEEGTKILVIHPLAGEYCLLLQNLMISQITQTYLFITRYISNHLG